jgi:hypothetical protein
VMEVLIIGVVIEPVNSLIGGEGPVKQGGS